MSLGRTVLANLRVQTSLVGQVRNCRTNPKWDLLAGICLQRVPVIVPELNWLQKRMQALFDRVEMIDSLYSDHEMRHFEDLRRAERIASGVDLDEKDLEEAAKQTAQDFEEVSLEELKQFKPANSITKADLCDNQQSIDRSLEKYLYLAVKTKIGNNEQWIFPEERHDSGESLRQTAERALQKCFPATGIHVKFLGNSPSVLYSYRYPKPVQQETSRIGARIFIFKCLLDVNHPKQPAAQGAFGERVLKPENCSDFSWLTRDELSQRLPKSYWNQISRSIYPDELIDIEKLVSDNKKKLTRITKKLKKIELSSSN